MWRLKYKHFVIKYLYISLLPHFTYLPHLSPHNTSTFILIDCIKRVHLLLTHFILVSGYKLHPSHVFGYNSLRTHGLLELGKQHPIESRFLAAVHLHRERHPTLTKSRTEFQVYNKNMGWPSWFRLECNPTRFLLAWQPTCLLACLLAWSWLVTFGMTWIFTLSWLDWPCTWFKWFQGILT